GRRRLSLERPRAYAPAASLGARRLADSAMDLSVRADGARNRTQPPAAHLPMEDRRQPAPQPRRPCPAGTLRPWLDPVARPARRLDRRNARRRRLPRLHPVDPGADGAGPRTAVDHL